MTFLFSDGNVMNRRDLLNKQLLPFFVKRLYFVVLAEMTSLAMCCSLKVEE